MRPRLGDAHFSYPKAKPGIGQISRREPQALDTGAKGKGAGDSTSSGVWKKQLRDDAMEAKTSYTYTSQAMGKETLVETESTAKGDN